MARIVIVGAARGIGRTCAEAFRDRGDDVLVVVDDAAVAEEAIGGILVANLGDPACARDAITQAAARHGGIDCLIVAVARMGSASLDRWSVPDWDAIHAVNLRLPFFCAQAAAPHLVRSADPSIVFLSSTAALRGQPRTGPYQASRAGLGALTRSLAAELGPSGVRVNCVLPGWIETPLGAAFWQTQADPEGARAAIDARIPLRRHGTPAEVASVVRFLASPAARYITGAEIPVDGGDTAV